MSLTRAAELGLAVPAAVALGKHSDGYASPEIGFYQGNGGISLGAFLSGNYTEQRVEEESGYAPGQGGIGHETHVPPCADDHQGGVEVLGVVAQAQECPAAHLARFVPDVQDDIDKRAHECTAKGVDSALEAHAFCNL